MDTITLVPSTSEMDDQVWTQGVCRNPSMLKASLDNFEDGNSRELQARLNMAKAFVSGGGRQQLFFFGPPGRGKTHLAVGIMREWIAGGGAAVYWPLMQLIGKLKDLMTPGKMETPQQRIEWLCNFRGLLIVDELGRSKGDTWDRDEVVYSLLDRRLALPTIWISNYGFDELAKIYDEAIASRLKSCLVVSWPGNIIPDHRERRTP